ncbi:MAG: hypothetical protein ACLQVD_10555 [Capsulimonadaceae bacterium]
MPAPPPEPKKPPKKPAATGPVINAEADKRLGRMVTQMMVTMLILLLAETLLMPVLSLRFMKYHKAIAYGSMFVVLVPFYWQAIRLFAARLEIGRDLVNKREWKQAIAALEPFNSFGQRWLDRSGEAHYLLSVAYTSLKNGKKAEQTRQFVLKHRPGPWSEKLGLKPSREPGKRPEPRL